jgi:hypothetical protein
LTLLNRRLTNNEVRIVKERAFDLEARLIAFAVRVIHAAESLPKTPTGNHIRNQLRETRVWLLMIQQAGLIKPATALDALLEETNELIAIFVASLKTTAKERN